MDLSAEKKPLTTIATALIWIEQSTISCSTMETLSMEWNTLWTVPKSTFNVLVNHIDVNLLGYANVPTMEYLIQNSKIVSKTESGVIESRVDGDASPDYGSSVEST